jgi:hypothetical protein
MAQKKCPPMTGIHVGVAGLMSVSTGSCSTAPRTLRCPCNRRCRAWRGPCWHCASAFRRAASPAHARWAIRGYRNRRRTRPRRTDHHRRSVRCSPRACGGGHRNTGASTLEAISRALNDKGLRTARCAHWHVSTVANLLARAETQRFCCSRTDRARLSILYLRCTTHHGCACRGQERRGWPAFAGHDESVFVKTGTPSH